MRESQHDGIGVYSQWLNAIESSIKVNIESIDTTGRIPPCSVSSLLINRVARGNPRHSAMKGNIMSIEQVKALVSELVADGVLYASVAHNIDWTRFEDEHLRASLVVMLNDLRQ